MLAMQKNPGQSQGSFRYNKDRFDNDAGSSVPTPSSPFGAPSSSSSSAAPVYARDSSSLTADGYSNTARPSSTADDESRQPSRPVDQSYSSLVTRSHPPDSRGSSLPERRSQLPSTASIASPGPRADATANHSPSSSGAAPGEAKQSPPSSSAEMRRANVSTDDAVAAGAAAATTSFEAPTQQRQSERSHSTRPPSARRSSRSERGTYDESPLASEDEPDGIHDENASPVAAHESIERNPSSTTASTGQSSTTTHTPMDVDRDPLSVGRSEGGQNGAPKLPAHHRSAFLPPPLSSTSFAHRAGRQQVRDDDDMRRTALSDDESTKKRRRYNDDDDDTNNSLSRSPPPSIPPFASTQASRFMRPHLPKAPIRSTSYTYPSSASTGTAAAAITRPPSIPHPADQSPVPSPSHAQPLHHTRRRSQSHSGVGHLVAHEQAQPTAEGQDRDPQRASTGDRPTLPALRIVPSVARGQPHASDGSRDSRRGDGEQDRPAQYDDTVRQTQVPPMPDAHQESLRAASLSRSQANDEYASFNPRSSATQEASDDFEKRPRGEPHTHSPFHASFADASAVDRASSTQPVTPTGRSFPSHPTSVPAALRGGDDARDPHDRSPFSYRHAASGSTAREHVDSHQPGARRPSMPLLASSSVPAQTMASSSSSATSTSRPLSSLSARGSVSGPGGPLAPSSSSSTPLPLTDDDHNHLEIIHDAARNLANFVIKIGQTGTLPSVQEWDAIHSSMGTMNQQVDTLQTRWSNVSRNVYPSSSSSSFIPSYRAHVAFAPNEQRRPDSAVDRDMSGAQTGSPSVLSQSRSRSTAGAATAYGHGQRSGGAITPFDGAANLPPPPMLNVSPTSSKQRAAMHWEAESDAGAAAGGSRSRNHPPPPHHSVKRSPTSIYRSGSPLARDDWRSTQGGSDVEMGPSDGPHRSTGWQKQRASMSAYGRVDMYGAPSSHPPPPLSGHPPPPPPQRIVLPAGTPALPSHGAHPYSSRHSPPTSLSPYDAVDLAEERKGSLASASAAYDGGAGSGYGGHHASGDRYHERGGFSVTPPYAHRPPPPPTMQPGHHHSYPMHHYGQSAYSGYANEVGGSAGGSAIGMGYPTTDELGRRTLVGGAPSTTMMRPTKYRKRSRAPGPERCISCGVSDTPEWRKGPGPHGARTLCNACGLHYSKLVRRKRTDEQNEQAAVSLEELRASLKISPI